MAHREAAAGQSRKKRARSCSWSPTHYRGDGVPIFNRVMDGKARGTSRGARPSSHPLAVRKSQITHFESSEYPMSTFSGLPWSRTVFARSPKLEKR